MGTSTVLIIGGVAVATGALAMVIKKAISKDSPTKQEKRSGEFEASIPNQILARKAFLSHLDDFALLLPSLESEIAINKWTETIVSVNDKDLTGLWAKCVQTREVKTKWIQLLASWQVKRDTCKSFTCLTNSNIAAYSLPDGSSLTMEEKYKVITPCWVYTFDDEQGQTIKRVVSKGIVVPISKEL